VSLRSRVHAIEIEDHRGRVRGLVDGRELFDTERAKILHEGRLPDRIYVPLDDFDSNLLEESDRSSHCPFKGDARYWSVRVGDRFVEDAIWAYPDPIDDVSQIAGFASFYPEKLSELEGAPGA
jgi:uncharacterized protein (DUF427 family)